MDFTQVDGRVHSAIKTTTTVANKNCLDHFQSDLMNYSNNASYSQTINRASLKCLYNVILGCKLHEQYRLSESNCQTLTGSLS